MLSSWPKHEHLAQSAMKLLSFVVHSFLMCPLLFHRQQRPGDLLPPPWLHHWHYWHCCYLLCCCFLRSCSAPAAATALGAPATEVTTSLDTAPTAAFAQNERLLGRPGRSLRPLLLGQGGVPRADYMDDLDPVAIFHRLHRRLEMTIFVKQRANKTRVQEGVRNSCLLVHAVPQWVCCCGEW